MGLFGNRKKEQQTLSFDIKSSITPKGNLYLVDFENVHDQGMTGIEELKENDIVIVFYGSQIKSISLDSYMAVMKTQAKLENLVLDKTAKNYLDFQLSTYLGYLIGKNEYDEIIIVSKDTGFDSVVDFWAKRKMLISRRVAISKTVTSVTEPKKAQKAKKEAVKSKKEVAKPKNEAGKLKNEASKSKKAQEKIKKSSEKKDLEIKDINNKPVIEDVLGNTPVVEVMDPIFEAPVEVLEEKTVEPGEKKAPSKQKKKTAKVKPEKKENTSGPASTSSPADKKLDLSEAYRKKIREAVKEEKLAPNQYTVIYKAFTDSKDKLELNNALVKSFKSAKGGQVYGLVKDIFENYKKEN